MATTARRLITGALQDLQVIAIGKAPEGPIADDALVTLNQMLDAMSLARGTLHKIVRTTKTLTSGTASYSIGTGGSIDIPRPIWIDAAGLILNTAATYPIEEPIDVLLEQDYQAWPQKTAQSSRSSAIYYDRGSDSSQRGLLYVLPIPSVSTTQLVLYAPGVPVSAFADLGTSYTLPQGWEWFLRKTLAIALAPGFQANVSPDLKVEAMTARANLAIANARRVRTQSDPALVGGRALTDIDTGLRW